MPQLSRRFCVVALVAIVIGCSDNIPKDLLDRSGVMEFTLPSQEASFIPNGVGGFKIKREMHRNGGWVVRDGRFFALMYVGPSDEPVDNNGVRDGFDSWIEEEELSSVRIWINGQVTDMSSVGMDTAAPVPVELVNNLFNLGEAESRQVNR